MRSLESLIEGHNVSTTPQARPTAITSNAPAQRPQAEKLSRSFTDTTTYSHWAPRFAEIAPFTTQNELIAPSPYSPSTRNSNHSTPSLRYGESRGPDFLHHIDARISSSTLSSPNPGSSRVTPSSRAFPISFNSEPSFANIGQSYTDIKEIFHSSKLVASPKSFQSPFYAAEKQSNNPPVSLAQDRTRSYGTSSTTPMAGNGEKEVGDGPGSDPVTSSEALAGAREEAFSAKRNRSSSRNGSGRVEKRIEATMANAEPASTARSRKSSHILGLFKENTASQEQKRSLEKVRTSSGLARQSTSVEATSEAIETPRFGTRPILTVSTLGYSAENAAITDGEDSPTFPTNDDEGLERYSSTVDSTTDIRPDQSSSKGLGTLKPLADVSNKSHGLDDSSEDDTIISAKNISHRFDDTSEGGLPIRLLEEIRNYHNLAAPIKDRIKVRSPSPKHFDIDDLAAVADKEDTAQDKAHGDSGGAEEDEDESDKEQISSALYYPHQAPSPDALQDVSIGSLDELEDSQQGLESLKSGSTSNTAYDDEGPSEDVDIALQSQNESKYLHGDFQKTRMPLEDRYVSALGSGTSSASDSEYDSLDEAAQSMNGEDSSATDDGETTPTATPKARSPFLRSPRGHRVPTAPLGAVELKPYNHQVGGHTTVFRFSKRAVCKQLSNRENEFYEVVERRHPKLLRFLPR